MLNLACVLLFHLGQQLLSAPELPSLLRPTAASVVPTFPPPGASLSSVSSPSHAFAAGPRAKWRFQSPPQMPNQFEQTYQITQPLQIERPRNIFPLEQPAVQPYLPFAVPARTVPSSVANSAQMVPNSSVVHSSASLITGTPQPTSDGNTTCISLDDELMSWLADIGNNPNSLGADVDVNGILLDVINDSSAGANSAAADAACTAATQLQTEVVIPELWNDTHLSGLLSQIQQLNEFGKPT